MDYLVIMDILTILIFLGLGMILGNCLLMLAVERKLRRGGSIVWKTDNGQTIKIARMKKR